MMARERKPGRTMVLVGGGVLAAWFLLRGKGWGFGGSGNGVDTGATGPSAAPRRAVVWIRKDHLELDGVAVDLPTLIARSRAASGVEVRATGDAITGQVWDVVKALHAASVEIYTTPDLAHVVPSETLP
jgi:hypothetical protein